MSDSINEQRCEQCGNGIEANCHVYTFAPGFHSFERPGPSVVTPPAQDEQPEFYEVELDPVSGEVTTRAVPAAPSVSTDDEKKPWRAYGALDDAMLEARPNGPSAREAAISDAAFAAGFRLGERLASGGSSNRPES